eukprot:m.51202 g.51202  ORF g.51202 m.51202 type:complete len:67 (+) comp11659_c0_seq1:83-283(+)
MNAASSERSVTVFETLFSLSLLLESFFFFFFFFLSLLLERFSFLALFLLDSVSSSLYSSSSKGMSS